MMVDDGLNEQIYRSKFFNDHSIFTVAVILFTHLPLFLITSNKDFVSDDSIGSFLTCFGIITLLSLLVASN